MAVGVGPDHQFEAIERPAPGLGPRRRGRTSLWVAIAVGVVVALLVAVLATRKSAESRLAQSPLLGRPAPPLSGTALDGRTVSLADSQGRWVVLNFFATWCVPCQQEHPELLSFAARHQTTRDAQILAVIWDDSTDRVKRFFQERGGEWPVIADPGGRIGLDYGVRGPPESYVIDPSGNVVAKFVGQVTADGLDQLLSQAKAAGA